MASVPCCFVCAVLFLLLQQRERGVVGRQKSIAYQKVYASPPKTAPQHCLERGAAMRFRTGLALAGRTLLVLFSYCLETGLDTHDRIGDNRVKLHTSTIGNYLDCLAIGKGRFVDPRADQRVVDIGR